MRKRRKIPAAPELLGSAPLFAALADQTRLRLVFRLCNDGPASLSTLTSGFRITRQAVTKHLRVMQKSGLVYSHRRGRERIWQLDQRRLAEVRRHLDLISRQWDDALIRLRHFVED